MTSSQVNVSETPPMSASDLEGLKEDNGLYAGKFKTVEDLVGSFVASYKIFYSFKLTCIQAIVFF